MAILTAPFSIAFGVIPSSLALFCFGLPLHKRLVRRGLTSVRHYSLAGLVAGGVAAALMALFMLADDDLRTHFFLVAPSVGLACLAGGAAAGALFRGIAGAPARSHAALTSP